MDTNAAEQPRSLILARTLRLLAWLLLFLWGILAGGYGYAWGLFHVGDDRGVYATLIALLPALLIAGTAAGAIWRDRTGIALCLLIQPLLLLWAYSHSLGAGPLVLLLVNLPLCAVALLLWGAMRLERRAARPTGLASEAGSHSGNT